MFGTVFLRPYDSFCGISIRPSPSQLWGKPFQEVYHKPQDHSELKDHGRYDFTLGRWTCPSWLPTDPSDPFCGCAFVRLLWERGVLEGGSGFATWLGCICPEWSHQLWIWHVLLALHVSQPNAGGVRVNIWWLEPAFTTQKVSQKYQKRDAPKDEMKYAWIIQICYWQTWT